MLYAGIEQVIVEVIENNNATPGDIELHEQAVERSNKGVVFGESDSFDENTLVYFKPYCGHRIVYEGRDYVVLHEEEILAYVETESDSDDVTGL